MRREASLHGVNLRLREGEKRGGLEGLEILDDERREKFQLLRSERRHGQQKKYAVVCRAANQVGGPSSL